MAAQPRASLKWARLSHKAGFPACLKLLKAAKKRIAFEACKVALAARAPSQRAFGRGVRRYRRFGASRAWAAYRRARPCALAAWMGPVRRLSARPADSDAAGRMHWHAPHRRARRHRGRGEAERGCQHHPQRHMAASRPVRTEGSSESGVCVRWAIVHVSVRSGSHGQVSPRSSGSKCPRPPQCSAA